MNKNAAHTLEPRPATKARRQGLIRSLLREAAPRSQHDMLRRLRGAGVLVAQSTLSRDLRDLGLMKGPAGYREPEEARHGATPEDRTRTMERMIRTYVTSVHRAGNLVVVKTPPGLAHALGLVLDRAELSELVGTVAGDDTVFAAAPDPSHARTLERRLRRFLGGR